MRAKSSMNLAMLLALIGPSVHPVPHLDPPDGWPVPRPMRKRAKRPTYRPKGHKALREKRAKARAARKRSRR